MPKVLLVEDDVNLSDTVKEWLLYEQFDVETAHSGPEAMEQLEFSTFDLVILDWHLPGMDGIDICKNYRAAGGTTPIIMLTGMDNAEERQAGLRAGANDYLKKPFKLKELSQRLKSLLEAHSAPTA